MTDSRRFSAAFYMDIDRPDLAKAAYQAAIDVNPWFVRHKARWHAAQAAIDIKSVNTFSAKEHLHAALKLYPDYDRAKELLAGVLHFESLLSFGTVPEIENEVIRLKKIALPEVALFLLQSGLTRFPKEARLSLLLGRLYFEMGRADLSVQAYEHVDAAHMKNYADLSRLHTARALCRLQESQIDQAVEELEAANALDEIDFDQILFQKVKGLQTSQPKAERTTTNARVQEVLAEQALYLGLCNLAAEAAQKAVRLKPGQPGPRIILVKALLKASQVDAAKSAWREASTRFKQHPELRRLSAAVGGDAPALINRSDITEILAAPLQEISQAWAAKEGHRVTEDKGVERSIFFSTVKTKVAAPQWDLIEPALKVSASIAITAVTAGLQIPDRADDLWDWLNDRMGSKDGISLATNLTKFQNAHTYVLDTEYVQAVMDGNVKTFEKERLWRLKTQDDESDLDVTYHLILWVGVEALHTALGAVTPLSDLKAYQTALVNHLRPRVESFWGELDSDIIMLGGAPAMTADEDNELSALLRELRRNGVIYKSPTPEALKELLARPRDIVHTLILFDQILLPPEMTAEDLISTLENPVSLFEVISSEIKPEPVIPTVTKTERSFTPRMAVPDHLSVGDSVLWGMGPSKLPYNIVAMEVDTAHPGTIQVQVQLIERKIVVSKYPAMTAKKLEEFLSDPLLAKRTLTWVLDKPNRDKEMLEAAAEQAREKQRIEAERMRKMAISQRLSNQIPQFLQDNPGWKAVSEIAIGVGRPTSHDPIVGQTMESLFFEFAYRTHRRPLGRQGDCLIDGRRQPLL